MVKWRNSGWDLQSLEHLIALSPDHSNLELHVYSFTRQPHGRDSLYSLWRQGKNDVQVMRSTAVYNNLPSFLNAFNERRGDLFQTINDMDRHDSKGWVTPELPIFHFAAAIAPSQRHYCSSCQSNLTPTHTLSFHTCHPWQKAGSMHLISDLQNLRWTSYCLYGLTHQLTNLSR